MPRESQWRQDAKAIWSAHSTAIVLGSVLFVTGATLCMTLNPEPRVMSKTIVSAVDVSHWAMGKTTPGVELASSSCPGGGTARNLTLLNELGSNFELRCEAPRLSRKGMRRIAYLSDMYRPPSSPSNLFNLSIPRLPTRILYNPQHTSPSL